MVPEAAESRCSAASIGQPPRRACTVRSTIGLFGSTTPYGLRQTNGFRTNAPPPGKRLTNGPYQRTSACRPQWCPSYGASAVGGDLIRSLAAAPAPRCGPPGQARRCELLAWSRRDRRGAARGEALGARTNPTACSRRLIRRTLERKRARAIEHADRVHERLERTAELPARVISVVRV